MADNSVSMCILIRPINSQSTSKKGANYKNVIPCDELGKKMPLALTNSIS